MFHSSLARRFAILDGDGQKFWLRPAPPTCGYPFWLRFAKPEGEMVLWSAAVLRCANDRSKYAVHFYDVAPFKHNVRAEAGRAKSVRYERGANLPLPPVRWLCAMVAPPSPCLCAV
jgi:hypothetical protein